MHDISIIFKFAEKPGARFFDDENGSLDVHFHCGFEEYGPAVSVDVLPTAHSKFFYCIPTEDGVYSTSEAFPVPENSILTLLRRYGGKAKVLRDGDLIARYKADANRLNVSCKYTALLK